MQKEQLIWNTEPVVEIKIQPGRLTPSNPHLTETPAQHRRIRVALPALPRRPWCLTKRAMLAALREAELAEWQASGGDYLGAVA